MEVIMDTTVIKTLNDFLRGLAGDVRRARAAHQILEGYARLNSSSEGIARAIGELQAAADELTKRIRQFSKAVSDLATTVTATTLPASEEAQ
jgi:methyl-accepting chemotaxis protein